MKLALALLLLAPALPANAALSAAPEPASAGATQTAVSPADLQNLAARAEKELRGNILPFWLKNSRDRRRGGFFGVIDQKMNVKKNAPRGALLTSRILWTFSAAYRRYHDPEYLEMARWAYRDQMDNFRDKEQGGLFWSITADGKPLDAHKQIYGQVFGLYALSEYYRATGEPAALDEAIAIYRLVDRHAHDDIHLGYFDTLSREWTQQKNTGRTLLGPGEAPKSQNSHIHIMEAFTSLLRVWPDEGLRARERELIELMLTRIIDARTHHLVLFMKADWTPIGEEFSYGHDIELSWLLVEAAEVLGDPAVLERVKPVTVAIARVTEVEGVDTDGGIFNEGNAGGVTNANKDWWPQAEAAVGFLNSYQISRDPAFFASALRSWNFIQRKFVDRQNGDWFESLSRDGTPLPRLKQSVWKCPYHNSRACLELMERLEKLGGAPEKH
jgi:cellobiose epimerase